MHNNSSEYPKFKSFREQLEWVRGMALKFVGPPKPKPETFQHEVYPYIGTSDRQRAYLIKHGIKHQRKDGEYR